MDVLSKIWQWLLDDNIRGALALLGAALATLGGAGWAIFRYRRKAKDTPQSNNAGLSAEQIQAIIEPLLAANKDQAARIEKLSRQLGISEAAVSGFFGTLGEREVPPERWAEVLAQIAQHHLNLLNRLNPLPTDDATIRQKRLAAREAVASGDPQRAEVLLKECEQLDLDASQRATKDAKARLRRATETRAARGELAMTQTDYRAAAVHFGRAAELADGLEADRQNRFLHERAHALYMQGTERGDNAALGEAIDAWRDLLNRQPHDRVPLEWAMTQNNVGNALLRLGERESGTAKLVEAVTAYRKALTEYTRDRGPLDWALTKNNLGIALERLSERESGTAKLEEAVAAYREALTVFQSAQADRYITEVRENLQDAERLLDQRR